MSGLSKNDCSGLDDDDDADWSDDEFTLLLLDVDWLLNDAPEVSDEPDRKSDEYCAMFSDEHCDWSRDTTAKSRYVFSGDRPAKYLL